MPTPDEDRREPSAPPETPSSEPVDATDEAEPVQAAAGPEASPFPGTNGRPTTNPGTNPGASHTASPPPTPPGAGPVDERRLRQRLEALIPELVKKTLYAGLGAAAVTEEQIRKVAGDWLPKDVVSYLLQSANSTKDEVFRIFAREIREFLQNLNLSQELTKLLTQLSFEIKTEIRFIPNTESVAGVKPDIKKKIRLKRTKDDGSTEDVPDEV
jgi:polyhydroxyalkanoate synthesis regulator phasin